MNIPYKERNRNTKPHILDDLFTKPQRISGRKKVIYKKEKLFKIESWS